MVAYGKCKCSLTPVTPREGLVSILMYYYPLDGGILKSSSCFQQLRKIARCKEVIKVVSDYS